MRRTARALMRRPFAFDRRRARYSPLLSVRRCARRAPKMHRRLAAEPATTHSPSPTPTPGPAFGNMNWREIGPAGGRRTRRCGRRLGKRPEALLHRRRGRRRLEIGKRRTDLGSGFR